MAGHAQDAMIARIEREIEERTTFVEGLVAGAQEANNGEGRDLSSQEMELVSSAQERMVALNRQLTPLKDTARIAVESRNRARQIDAQIGSSRRGADLPPVEYRSAGAYITDYVGSYIGNREATERLEIFTRAAAHQTTADNAGLLPERLLGPILGQLDFGRPLVSAFGPQQLPAGAWSRPKITQHTQVGKQSAEKTELASRKMLIGKVALDGDTFGGYVNVSRQNIDWTQPQIIDIIIGDLTNEYAFETEEELGAVLAAGATTGPVLPAGATTQAQFMSALWTAAGQAYAGMWAARMPMGSLILAAAPDMVGVFGPLFPPVNPQNAQSTGFDVSVFGDGPKPPIAGIVPVVSGALAAGTIIVAASNAVEVYEDRIGALQVVEPSVLGTQVAYAGYFAPLIMAAGGVIEITKATS